MAPCITLPGSEQIRPSRAGCTIWKLSHKKSSTERCELGNLLMDLAEGLVLQSGLLPGIQKECSTFGSLHHPS